ncbi:MAG: restriction endonuclease subunit S, partial [Parvularculaceae bacterium]
ANFDTLFTTEESIDALKQLIFELAVRGTLVPQDPADGNAAELIESFDQQAVQPSLRKLVSKYFQKGRLTKNNGLHTIPSNWEWVNVAKLGHNWGQSEPECEFTYIDVSSIDQRAGVVVEPNIIEAKNAPSRARKIVKRGTVIYSTVRPYLRNIAVVESDFDPLPIASTAFAIVHPFDGVDAQYVYRVFRSPFFVRYVESCQTGIAYPAINDKQFFNAPFPLPPLAEQKRIVAKVDELMALCDCLKARFAEAAEVQRQLSDTVTRRVVA